MAGTMRVLIKRTDYNEFRVCCDGQILNPPIGFTENSCGGFDAKVLLGDTISINVPVPHVQSEPDESDVVEQAKWELSIERFEKAVEEAKEKLRKKKSWFPWRIRFINMNEVK